jgi:hypothetical protein
MKTEGSPGKPAGNRVLGLILALLGAIAGYFLARYLMSR